MKPDELKKQIEALAGCTGLSGPVRIETPLPGCCEHVGAKLHRPFGAGED